MTRTIGARVMFRHPFHLAGMAGPQPPGVYALTTREEELRGPTFIMFRTVAVFLWLPALDKPASDARQVPITMEDLEACVLADRKISEPKPLPAPR